METGVVVRGSGFTALSDAEAVRVARLLDAVAPALAAAPAIPRPSAEERLDAASSPKTGVARVNPAAAPSAAERFGRSVRELHGLYAALVDAMRPSRAWVALRLHSTAHADGAGVAVVLEHTGEVRVSGYAFDPAVFLLPWHDNTLDHPWRPWGFVLAPFSDDADDAHAFVELTADGRRLTGRATLCAIGAPDVLRVAGLNIALPAGTPTPAPTQAAPSLFEVLDAKVKQQPSLTKHNMARVDLSLLLFNARSAVRDLWIAAERAALSRSSPTPALTAAVDTLRPIFGAPPAKTDRTP